MKTFVIAPLGGVIESGSKGAALKTPFPFLAGHFDL